MSDPDKLIVGWREWVALPGLGVPAIRAKIDTGARTSALHAINVKRYRKDGKDWVAFDLEPSRRYTQLVLACDAAVVDERVVKDSGGHTEHRLVIQTALQLRQFSKPIELTLTERPNMRFRMLLGRTSLVPDMLVNPSLSYHQGRMRVKTAYADYLKRPDSEEGSL